VVLSLEMDQESSGIELVYVCVCEGVEERLGCGFILLYSIVFILYGICYLLYVTVILLFLYSIFYILCTTLKVIEIVETELLKVNEGVEPELLKVDRGVDQSSWQGRVSRV